MTASSDKDFADEVAEARLAGDRAGEDRFAENSAVKDQAARAGANDKSADDRSADDKSADDRSADDKSADDSPRAGKSDAGFRGRRGALRATTARSRRIAGGKATAPTRTESTPAKDES